MIEPWMEWVLWGVTIVFFISVVLCMVQAVIGAYISDRVVSIDALTSLTIAILGFLAAIYKKSIFLDVALVYALIAFVGTLAVSKYLEGRDIGE
ncbi:hypothetical protein AKJ62_04315 [candidate division MSBL1 archaeon SCGC-AAA259D14]|uniref:Cation:proton antiporter n=1 Tax=candidate division MSBL1 archaeon SCGC-AAA259D14 TaxID=1698261 RepID=A0A133U3V7_9EURY|nr:hypothetical protein AKJ62_04315 [candidate division MSBL1 archaeon SCGC-AAA259D14]